MNTTTTAGASKLKDKLETKIITDFNNDVITKITWFANPHDQIIKEEGNGYDEYIRSLFCPYIQCNNEEFVDAVATERYQRMQCRLKYTYISLDLLELVNLTSNNLLDYYAWGDKPTVKLPNPEDKQYLFFGTEILA